LVAVLLALSPLTTSANVTGGCSVTATASVSGPKNLINTDRWHLKSTDEVKGEATYPTQTYVHVFVFLFGIPIPVYSSNGKDTHGTAGPFAVSDYSKYTRVFAAGGQSDTCSGSVLIIVDDQSPLTNATGLVAVALLVVGSIGLLMLALGRGAAGCGGAFFGGLSGLIFALGVVLIAAEADVIDLRRNTGLIVTGVGLIVGILVAQIRSRTAPHAT
jgi:hypothetical protein